MEIESKTYRIIMNELKNLKEENIFLKQKIEELKEKIINLLSK